MAKITRRTMIRASGAAVASAVVGSVLAGCSAGSTASSAAAPAATLEPAEQAKPLKVRAAVFSPTGGTTNATYLLAEKFSSDVEIIDQTALSTRTEEISFAQDELAIWAAPSYAGKIPYVPDLFTNLKGSQTPCILVASFGNRACENNFAQMKAIAEKNGFVVAGAIAIVTPHTLGAKAGHSRPSLDDQKVLQEFATKVLAKLAYGPVSSISVEGSAERGEKYESNVEKVYTAETCTKCGTCVSNCPVGAIDPQTMEIDGTLCIHCQRCTHVCAFNARNYLANREGVDSKYFSPQPVTYIV